MSETTEQNGTAVDVSKLDPALLELLAAVDPAQLKDLKEKDDKRRQRLAEAAAERKRTNNRGKMPDGETDRNPAQAYLNSLGQLLRNWTTMYAKDPAQIVRRLNEQLIPSIIAASNTASTQMGAGMDARRGDYNEWHAVTEVEAPKAPASSTK